MSPSLPELRGKDLLSWPSLLTGARLGIAVGFPFLLHFPQWAFWAYVIALGTDIADGWLARRLGCASQAGAIADGWVDKILHVNAGWALWIHGYMPGVWLVPLFARELIQFPQILWLAGPFWRGEVCAQQSRLSGKLTSVFQALAFVSIFQGWFVVALSATVATGVSGAWAAVEYVTREAVHGYGQTGRDSASV
ncbi:MAG: CDP-alcohol phosphatidyltransferase family protein [Myxococcota bacterium]|nr:CDP-alcohol phosphatidyltransferase family protein [Myxococcota bacterium]